MSGMKCLSCGGITDTKDSRPLRHASVVKRTRKCRACNDSFATYEVSKALYQRLETFGATDNSDRDHLLIALQKMHNDLGSLIKKRKAAL